MIRLNWRLGSGLTGLLVLHAPLPSQALSVTMDSATSEQARR